MNFKAKNFSYASMRFGDFLDEVERGEKLYLRALSSRNAKEVPTILEDDYPSLATDFKLPGKSLIDPYDILYLISDDLR
jgi:tRNA wybutosine-synthesizing protein 4